MMMDDAITDPALLPKSIGVFNVMREPSGKIIVAVKLHAADMSLLPKPDVPGATSALQAAELTKWLETAGAELTAFAEHYAEALLQR
jgi:hypothetical protein